MDSNDWPGWGHESVSNSPQTQNIISSGANLGFPNFWAVLPIFGPSIILFTQHSQPWTTFHGPFPTSRSRSFSFSSAPKSGIRSIHLFIVISSDNKVSNIVFVSGHTQAILNCFFGKDLIPHQSDKRVDFSQFFERFHRLYWRLVNQSANPSSVMKFREWKWANHLRAADFNQASSLQRVQICSHISDTLSHWSEWRGKI